MYLGPEDRELNPTVEVKALPEVPVGLAWEKCLPNIKFSSRVTLQRWGQAATGSRRVPSEHLAAAHCHQRLRASAKLKMTPCKAPGWGGEGWDASFPDLRRHSPRVLDHKVLAWPSS